MKISVVSPSFNQAQFLPDNLRTVAAQTGVDVEHIIIDPGSTDGSTELAAAAKHAILLNEPDRGQSHGITKGYAMATGDVIVWLNSDDFYPSPDTLAKVARAFEQNPDADVIYGNVNFVDENGKFLRAGFVNKDSANLLKSFQYQVGIVQPGVFMKKKVFDAVGGPSEDYNYCMDYEYWVRIAAAGFKWVFLNEVLAHHRWWDGMKTSSGRGDSLIEHFKVGMTYFGYIHHKWLDRYGEFMATNADGVVNQAATVDAGAKASRVRRAIRRFVTQDMLAFLEKATDSEATDTLAYIRRHVPNMKRVVFDTSELEGAVSSHPDPMAKQRVAWHVFNTITSKGEEFKTYEVPANFSRSFEAQWYNDQHSRAVENLHRLSARRKETCVIVANGPSLNASNLDLLEHTDVIISNYAIISKQLLRHATYLTVVNDLVAKQGATRFNALDIPKVVPFWLANSFTATDSTFYVPATVEPVFNGALEGTFSWRSTVSFLNMQLAYALGYEKVVLIGFDHSYQQAADMKEGMAVDQKTEDPNHFDPRYFQGKIWQAADTGNMEKSYVIARDAFAAGGRSIVNATVGGQLEVFPRTTLEEAIGLDRRSFPVPALPASPVQSYPRLLVIDMTATGNGTATGEIKANLLADWPEASFLQIAKHGSAGLSAVRRTEGGFVEREFAAGGEAAKSVEAARAAIDAFSPDIVLYRPTPDTEALHRFAMDEIQRLNKPLVTWIMDDWPARMAAEKPEAWARMKPDLNDLLARSKVRLSICEAMSGAFLKRYAVPFRPLANGIDPADWPGMEKLQRESFVLRYAGGLAADMNRDSVLRIAAAVENLARAGKRIRFEISTHSHWLKQCETLFEPFKATKLAVADKTLAEYRAWLSDADALLIAYNFDEASMRYVRYSMANKMPECLASGAVVLAHGPRDVATIDYLAGVEGAVVVSENSGEAVEKALSALIDSPVRCAELAAKARATAFDRHNIIRLRADLRRILTDAAQRGSGVAHALPELRGNAPLTHFSALLLMDPQAALSKLGSDSALKTTVAAAVANDATDPQLSEHLKRCLAFAKIDLNKLK